MSDDIIHVGNTPIFDELVRRMGERKFNTLLSPKGLGALQPVPIPGTTFDLPKPAQDAQRMWGVSALQAAQNLKDALSQDLISEIPIAYTGLKEGPVLERNVCPDVLSKRLISLNHFINEMVKEFQEKHPEVHPIHITRLDEIDGTITIRVTKAELEEQTDEDVNAAPKSVVRPLASLFGIVTPTEKSPIHDVISDVQNEFYRKHPNAQITSMLPKREDDGSITMVIQANEPTIADENIPSFEDITGDKLPDGVTVNRDDFVAVMVGKMSINDLRAKYLGVRTSTWGSDEE
jgi:hypothetical protein